MIPALVGLGLLIGGAILVAGWKAVVEWLDKFVKKLKEVWAQVKPLVPAVAAVYGDTFVEGAELLCRVMHKLYYKEGEDWIEETTTCKVKESEVPESIRKKLSQDEECDITKDMEMELGYEI